MRRIRGTASSVMAPRCRGVRPTASHSASLSTPSPKAGSMRPLLRKSMVAISFASTRGSRTGRTATLMPNLMRSVRPAIIARPVMGSRAGVGLRMRSLSQIESSPLSSTRSTKSQKSSVRAKGQPLKPTPIRIFIVVSLLCSTPNWRHLRWAVHPASLAGIVVVRSTRAQHLAWEGACLLEPGAVIFIEQWGNRLLDLLVVACEPGTLSVRKLGPVYEPLIEGDKRQRVELQPAFTTRVRRHIVVWHDHIEVLEANTTPAFLVIARLIRYDHAWLQRLIAAARA